MSIAHDLAEFRGLLEKQAELKISQLQVDLEIRVLEKRMELEAIRTPDSTEGRSEVELFIDRHRDELSACDLEFLDQPQRGIGEVIEYLGASKSTVDRLTKANKIQLQPSSHSHRRWDTLSVARYLIDGASAKKDERRVGSDG